MKRRILGKQLVTWSEARSIMEDRVREEDPPILAEQERTWEYLKLVGARDPSREREAVKKLMELGLSEALAVNMVNICPREPGEVRLVLAMEKELVYDEDMVRKVLEIVGECREE